MGPLKVSSDIYCISNVDLQNWQFTTCPRMAMKSSVAPHDGHECILISDFPFGTESVIDTAPA